MDFRPSMGSVGGFESSTVHPGVSFYNSNGYRIQSYMCQTHKNLRITSHALVFAVHNVGSHSQEAGMRNIFRFLAAQGFLVFMFDLQGHGRSTGEPMLIKDYHDQVLDLVTFVNTVCGRYHDLPYFLLGFGAGASLAILASLELQKQMDSWDRWLGCILCAPWIRPLINASKFRSFLVNCCPASLYCLSAEMNRAYRRPPQDPLVYDFALPNITLEELFKMSQTILESLAEISFPFLLFHGENDFITDINASQELFENSITKDTDKEFHRIPDAYHAIYADPADIQRNLQNRITSWITQRLAHYHHRQIELEKVVSASIDTIEFNENE